MPPKVILVADDNQVGLRVMQHMLHKICPDVAVLISNHTSTLIDLVTQNEIAMVFTDILFLKTKTDSVSFAGLDLIRIIREYERDASVEHPVPIIAFSSDPSQRSAALQAGASFFLDKPIDRTHMEQVLRAFNIT